MAENENIKMCDIVGNFGKYQFALLALSFVTSWYMGLVRLFMELLAPSVSLYWDWEASNPNKTVFRSFDCKMAEIFDYNRTSNFSDSSSKLIYDSPYSRRTLTEKLNLICERSWLVSLTSTMLLTGYCTGSLFFGRLTEIYGRTRCTIWMAFLCFISNILLLFPQGYIMLLLAAFLYGATGPSTATYLVFQVLEMTPNKWSDYAAVFGKAGQIVGQTLMVGAAWIIQDWFYTQVVHTVFAGALLVSSLYALESPMWLVVRGRYEETERNLERIIIRNGLDPVAAKPKIARFLEQMKQSCETGNKAEKGNFSELFKNRVIAFQTIAMCLIRGLTTFMYTSLILNAETFGSGMYVDLTISNVLALTSFLFSTALIKTFSLRTQTIFLCLCAGIACIFYTFLLNFAIARSALIILGRMFLTPVLTAAFVIDNQITPTSVRGVAAGVKASATGLISALTPFTKELAESTAPFVPFILFAVCGFVSAGLLKLLPETEGKLVHTVDELVKKKRSAPNVVYIIPTN